MLTDEMKRHNIKRQSHHDDTKATNGEFFTNNESKSTFESKAFVHVSVASFVLRAYF
jgi:hypothetical protein